MTSKILLISLLFLFSLKTFSQNTGYGQSNPPPSTSVFGGTFPFFRGIFVDCADFIISDMVASNTTKETELIQYCLDNDIRYIAFFGLDNGAVIGNPNPAYEAQLVNLILALRTNFPNIQLGPVCSSRASIQYTSPIFINDPSIGISSNCDPIHERMAHYDSLLNPQGQLNAEEMQTSELMKSIFRAAQFNGAEGGNTDSEDGGHNEEEAFHVTDKCSKGFDFIFVESEYWYGTFIDQQNKYNNLVDACKFGQDLKCKYNCIQNIDAELQPADIIDNTQTPSVIWKNQQAQIDELDFIIDRPSLVSYTKPLYWDITFDWQCDNLRRFAQTSNKKHSRPLIQYSAEKSSYLKCFSNVSVTYDYLGGFLDGTSYSPLGNMYDVEFEYLRRLESTTYACPSCTCTTHTENHYSSSNQYANVIQGSVWFTYGLFLPQYNTALLGQTIYRLTKDETNSEKLIISPNPFVDNLKIINSGININRIVIHDSNNKIISILDCSTKDCLNIGNLSPGMYVIEINYNDGTSDFQKAVCIN